MQYPPPWIAVLGSALRKQDWANNEPYDQAIG